MQSIRSDSDLTLYAPASRPLSAGSPGLAAARIGPDGGGRRLSYLLEVDLAREAIEVWSEWRNGRVPTRDERVAAVAFYADNDAYLPVDSGVD